MKTRIFPYQKKIINMGFTLEDYTKIQEFLAKKGIDLSHVSHRGFRLFKFLNTDVPGVAGMSTCWLEETDMVQLFTDPEKFLLKLEQ